MSRRSIPLGIVLEVADAVHPKYADLALRAAAEAAQRFDRKKLGPQVDTQRKWLWLSVQNAIRNERRRQVREVRWDFDGKGKPGPQQTRPGTKYPREYESVDGLLRVDHREIQFRMALAVGALPQPESGLIARMYYGHPHKVLSYRDTARHFKRSLHWVQDHLQLGLSLLGAMPEVQWCGAYLAGLSVERFNAKNGKTGPDQSKDTA